MKGFRYVNTFVIAIALLVIFISYSFYNASNNEAQIGGSKFVLTDHEGSTVTQKNLLGKYSLIMFGFSRCPHICPAQVELISQVLEHNLNNLQVFFITLDPATDTVEKLNAFHKNFHQKIRMLTGSKETIDQLVKDYKIYVERNVDPEKFNHSAIIYLLAPNGKYLAHFTPSSSEELYEELKKEMKIKT